MPVKNVVSVPAEEDEGSFGSDPVEGSPDIADALTVEDLVRTVVVKIRGKDTTIKYDLGERTPRLRKMLAAMEDSEAALRFYLETVVIDWDLTDKRGNAVEVAVFEDVPDRDTAIILAAILADQTPND